MAWSAHQLSAMAKAQLDWVEAAPGRWHTVVATRSLRDRCFEELSVLGLAVARDENDLGFVLEVRS